MTCKLCNSSTEEVFTSKVLNKYNVKYYKCKYCGFIQTEKPYWLGESYSSAISSLDLGLVSRNLSLVPVTTSIIEKHFDVTGKFLDYGGGYGLFVRLMRDKGFDFYRQDIYCPNIFAEHFDINDLEGEKTKFELLTAFEVFEHLEYPLIELEKMFKLSDSILFSTEIQPSENVTPNNWWYFVPEIGQHISFYSKKSFETIAQKFSCYFYSNNSNLHILTLKKMHANPFRFAFEKKILYKILNESINLIKILKRDKIHKSLLQKDFELVKSKILNQM